MSNLQKHILAFVEWLLPRGLREECMHELRKVYQPVGDLVNQSVKTIIGAYRVQVSASFNRACFVL